MAIRLSRLMGCLGMGCFSLKDLWLMSVPHISLTLSVTMVPSASSLGCARRDGARASRSLPSPGAPGEGSREPLQRAVAPIVCDSLRRESRTLRFPGGYDRPGQHPDKGLSDRGDGRSQAMAFP